MYISVDSTVYVIVTISIQIIALLNFLSFLVPQLRLNSNPGSEVNAVAVVSDTQPKCVLARPTGFYQRAVRVVDVNPMSFFYLHVNSTSLFGKSFLYGQQIYIKNATCVIDSTIAYI